MEGMKQQTLAMAVYHSESFKQHRRPTKREEFLARIMHQSDGDAA